MTVVKNAATLDEAGPAPWVESGRAAARPPSACLAS